MNIAVIDYKMSNMFSIKNALDFLGNNCIVTSDHNLIMNADGAVLPGVGSFPEAMQHLHDLKLVDVVKEYISTKKPFMGICLGLQLLFSNSEEFENCEGLNIIGGHVKNFSNYIHSKPIPHVGWNSIINNNLNEKTFKDLQLTDNEYYYFVHSYFVKPENNNHILTYSSYDDHKFCSSIIKDNIFACQFHPEKSGIKGLNILNSFFNYNFNFYKDK